MEVHKERLKDSDGFFKTQEIAFKLKARMLDIIIAEMK